MNAQTKFLLRCPGCRGSDLEEITQLRTFLPRKKPVEVPLLAMRCRDCGTEFTTGRQHDENLQRLAKRREDPNYDGILLGEDILRLRMRYGLTQRDASRIFGAGKIAFSRYENEVTYPDEAMTNLLRLAIEKPSVIKWLADQKGVALPLWEARCAEERRAKVAVIKATSVPVGYAPALSKSRVDSEAQRLRERFEWEASVDRFKQRIQVAAVAVNDDILAESEAS